MAKKLANHAYLHTIDLLLTPLYPHGGSTVAFLLLLHVQHCDGQLTTGFCWLLNISLPVGLDHGVTWCFSDFFTQTSRLTAWEGVVYPHRTGPGSLQTRLFK